MTWRFEGGPFQDGAGLDGKVRARKQKRRRNFVDELEAQQAEDGFIKDVGRRDPDAPTRGELEHVERELDDFIDRMDVPETSAGQPRREFFHDELAGEFVELHPGLTKSERAAIRREGMSEIQRWGKRDFARLRSEEYEQDKKAEQEHAMQEQQRALLDDLHSRFVAANPDLAALPVELVADAARKHKQDLNWNTRDWFTDDGQPDDDGRDAYVRGVGDELRQRGFGSSGQEPAPSDGPNDIASLVNKRNIDEGLW